MRLKFLGLYQLINYQKVALLQTRNFLSKIVRSWVVDQLNQFVEHNKAILTKQCVLC